jgi:hypothetical protein
MVAWYFASVVIQPLLTDQAGDPGDEPSLAGFRLCVLRCAILGVLGHDPASRGVLGGVGFRGLTLVRNPGSVANGSLGGVSLRLISETLQEP